jgi:GTP pyrophosphokinase
MVKQITNQEKNYILTKYHSLLRTCKPLIKENDIKLIGLAFDIASENLKNSQLKSGEAYILRPLAIAQITAKEIISDTNSVICSLLYDAVEKNNDLLQTVEKKFGKTTITILKGLKKLSFAKANNNISLQSEKFIKLVLTEADDVRILLIKLAIQLYNMRTLNLLPKQEQIKISSEIHLIYCPIAHRIGLYNVKKELEELAMKYTKPEIYGAIDRKQKDTKLKHNAFIREFVKPIKKLIEDNNFDYKIKARYKSVCSVWNKMQKQNIKFEEVYDIFAIRIIINSSPKNEKSDCWKAYSIVTNIYEPNTNRLRDWISFPKPNGYESLHTTVSTHDNRWVEVQIRTKRMDETAEKGNASHWRYKEKEKNIKSPDKWLKNIRDILENPDTKILDSYKQKPYSNEIFIFTPKGDLKKLPYKATILDFAYQIHSDIGDKCTGAKVNNKIVPIRHILQNGDKVEIITSKNQKPKSDWLNFVNSKSAKAKIKRFLNHERYKKAELGKDILKRKFNQLKIKFNNENIQKILSDSKLDNILELYHSIATKKFDVSKIKNIFTVSQKTDDSKLVQPITRENIEDFVKYTGVAKSNILITGYDFGKIDYKLAKCCNPNFGDNIFAFVTVKDGIKIHCNNCPNAQQMKLKYPYRVMEAKWVKRNVVKTKLKK